MAATHLSLPYQPIFWHTPLSNSKQKDDLAKPQTAELKEKLDSDSDIAMEPPLKKAHLALAPASDHLPSFADLLKNVGLCLEKKPTSTRKILNDVAVLGEGTEGIVVAGKDSSGFPAAVKVNHSWVPISRAQKAASHLKILAEQKTPHRLHFREAYYRQWNEHVTVTDLVPEKDMSCSDSLLTFPEVITVGRQALEFLDSLLKIQTKHADLRTENLIFEKTSQYLTIVDAGKSTRSKLFPDHFLQGNRQPPPEEILNGPFRCSYDIWSLGCILYEVFTGTRLFYVPRDGNVLNYKKLMRMFVEQIGFPSEKFLSECTRAQIFFNLNGELWDGPCTVTYHWKVSIRAKGIEKSLSLEQIEKFIKMLQKMLCWENRAHPKQLLKMSLFNNDIKFHLSPAFTSDDTIYFYRCTGALNMPEQTPSLTINLGDGVTRTCFHIQRAPQDVYYLEVYRRQTMISRVNLKIYEGNTISI